MSPLDEIQAIASVATAIGVLLAGWQLNQSKKQALTSFEDSLASQYRHIIREIPVKALLGETLDKEEQNRALPHFYHYFDLSNEQAYLHRRGRVRSQTWTEWRDGITDNLRRPAFKAAWEDVSRRAPESFNDLRNSLAQRLYHPSPSFTNLAPTGKARSGASA